MHPSFKSSPAKSNRFRLPPLATAIALAAVPFHLTAAIVYWDSNDTTPGAGVTPTGTWGTSTFWSPDATGASPTVAWIPGDIAVFSAGTDATGAYTVTLSAAQTAAGLTIEEGTVALAGSALGVGTGTVAINPGAKLSIPATGNLTASAGANLNLDGSTILSTVNGAGSTFLSANFTINIGVLGGTVETANTGTNSSVYAGTIKGPGNTLTKTGSGEFRYQGAGLPNTTFARLVVNQGLFRLGFAASTSDERGFGAVPGAFLADAITLSGGGSIGTSFAAANSVLHANRGITLGAGGGAINGTLTIPGAITGAGSLSHLTTGTTFLNGNSDYSGTTFVTLGIVSVGAANGLGSTAGDTQVASGAEVRFDGAGVNFTTSEPFQIAGAGGGGGGAITIQNSATPTLSGPITLTGDATITVAGSSTALFNNASAITSVANQNLTLQGGSGVGGGGTIAGVIALGTGGLTKLQGGKWTLTAANTYGGLTTITAGTLQLGNGLAGNDGTINSSAGIVDNATLAFNRFGTDTYGGVISGTGGVTKLGTGTEILSGANTYTGLTKIDLGILRLGAGDRIANASSLLLNGGTFDTAGFSETLGALDVDAASILNFGTGLSALAFADSDAQAWLGTLTILNWTPGLDTFRVGLDGTGFDTQLSLMQFADFGNAPGQIDANGYVTPLVVPEPTAALLSAFGSLGLLLRLRRRS